jgi:hypothetical protein
MAMLAVYHDPVGGNPHPPKLNSPPEIYVARLPSNSDDDVIEADPVEESSVPSPGFSRARVIYPDAAFLDDERCAQSGSAPIRRYRVIAGGGDLPPDGDPSDDEAVHLREPLPDSPMYRHINVGIFEDVFGGLHFRCYLSRRARRVLIFVMGFGIVIATGRLSEVAELVAKLLF